VKLLTRIAVDVSNGDDSLVSLSDHLVIIGPSTFEDRMLLGRDIEYNLHLPIHPFLVFKRRLDDVSIRIYDSDDVSIRIYDSDDVSIRTSSASFSFTTNVNTNIKYM